VLLVRLALPVLVKLALLVLLVIPEPARLEKQAIPAQLVRRVLQELPGLVKQALLVLQVPRAPGKQVRLVILEQLVRPARPETLALVRLEKQVQPVILVLVKLVQPAPLEQ